MRAWETACCVVALWYGAMRGGFQQEKEAYSAPINIPFLFFRGCA